MKYILVVLAAVLAVSSGQSVCSRIQVLPDFDVVAYTGLWYEIQRFPTSFEPHGSCVTALYSLYNGNDTNADPVVVYNRLYNDGTGQYEDITGSARLVEGTTDAKLLVSFPVAPFPAPYWVVDTDYTSFSVVVSCAPVVGVSTSWILSRETTLSAEAQARVDAAIDNPNNLIDRSKFVPTRQGGTCIYA